MSEPTTLRTVLAACRRGTSTVEDIARGTGVDPDLVRVALDQLRGLGLLTAETTGSGCPEGGCTGCPAPTGAGCDESRRGLVTLRLGRRPD